MVPTIIAVFLKFNHNTQQEKYFLLQPSTHKNIQKQYYS